MLSASANEILLDETCACTFKHAYITPVGSSHACHYKEKNMPSILSHSRRHMWSKTQPNAQLRGKPSRSLSRPQTQAPYKWMSIVVNLLQFISYFKVICFPSLLLQSMTNVQNVPELKLTTPIKHTWNNSSKYLITMQLNRSHRFLKMIPKFF